MNGEYNDAKIGELEEDIAPDEEEMIKPEQLMEAVDEFIEDTKMRFHKLSKAHRYDYIQDEAILLSTNDKRPRLDEVIEDPETAKLEQMKKQTIASTLYDKEADEAVTSSSEEEEESWDCESILSTYTNTDNHPGVIKTTKRVRPNQKQKIDLHKAFRVPVDGLEGLTPMAEEITRKIEKKKAENSTTAYTQKDEDSDVEDNESQNTDFNEANPDKARKKEIKTENREKRKLKKQLKNAF